ncbi:hypothetical protein JQ616_29770 [Bradyrhizobium tropiciagri]|uniref:hypothetical protein n=1 Tax=Bradyrhizobium tropiciagri TaxID=312253 RepID=UPI001BAE4FF8|nr:hypothetical protein [Bradyrhizobium tropiciagri]MBR0899161.1 hypothetical protein [Bradyrhizobium tropiciagri]
MSASFDRLIDGMIEALRSHVLPRSGDEFVRGQIFSTIFALNGLKLTADWKAGPLLEQVRVQDAALAEVGRLAGSMEHPPIPTLPRTEGAAADSAAVEALRDDGDRILGELLFWASNEGARAANPAIAREIELFLRRSICEQLKVELAMTPKSMLHQIATGEEGA